MQQRFRKLGEIIQAAKTVIKDKDLKGMHVTPDFGNCSVYVEMEGRDRPFMVGEVNRDGDIVLDTRNVTNHLHIDNEAFLALGARR